MKRKLVISDIHGCYDEFIKILELASYSPSDDQLIILGDMIDRGKKSKEVLEHIMNLQDKYDVIVISGNHEELFLNWLDEPYDRNHIYGQNGGWKTIESFCKPYKVYGKTPRTKAVIREHYSKHVGFIRNLRNYHEDEQFIFVHAGVNLSLDDWRNSTSDDFRWIREEFWYKKNGTNKTIIFGHTPTVFLHEDKKLNIPKKSYEIWNSNDNKICIDGGSSMGGPLHCLCIDDNGYTVFSI